MNQLFSGSWSGLEGFMKNRKKWTDKKEVDRELRTLKGYALHKDVRKKFKRRRIMVNFQNEIFAADLKDVQKLADDNLCYRFILVVTDGLSKKLYTALLKDKTSKSMIKGFKKVFKAAGATPRFLFVDRGNEFIGKEVQTFLKEKRIKTYHVYSHIKSSWAERQIRNLYTKLARYMTQKETNKFYDVVDSFVKSINNSYNRSIKMPPNAVTKATENEAWNNLYSDYLEEIKKPRPPPKFARGSVVRISKEKLLFAKVTVEKNFIVIGRKNCRNVLLVTKCIMHC